MMHLDPILSFIGGLLLSSLVLASPLTLVVYMSWASIVFALIGLIVCIITLLYGACKRSLLSLTVHIAFGLLTILLMVHSGAVFAKLTNNYSNGVYGKSPDW
jgi:hypothetical protein